MRNQELHCPPHQHHSPSHVLLLRRFSFSAMTVGMNSLSVTKSPAMMLSESSLDPGFCSRTQLSSIGYVDMTMSLSDSVGWEQMYFRSSVRLIPVTKKPSEKLHAGFSLHFIYAVLQTHLAEPYLGVHIAFAVQTPRSELLLYICWPTSRVYETTALCGS